MRKSDLLQGNLETMILRIRRDASQHGWGIAPRIQVLTASALEIEDGSLHLALYRIHRMGWINADGHPSENNCACCLEPTAVGRRHPTTRTPAGDRPGATIAPVTHAKPIGDGSLNFRSASYRSGHT